MRQSWIFNACKHKQTRDAHAAFFNVRIGKRNGGHMGKVALAAEQRKRSFLGFLASSSPCTWLVTV